ncbi:MAG: asparaginase [Clostridia bacterium]|nr:asparaginase [Clostridia bacterium]
MKNILLILVGGTICTELNEKGNLSVSEKAGVLLKTNFENSDSIYANKVHIDLSKNLYILSENMTIDKWNLIIDTYRQYTRNKHYDGIIFAHGTDTLAYSAALFSQLLAGTDIPVFFVSANERLESERTNGNANFRCAVECICRGISPNIYVTYMNLSDKQMYLHIASRLCQCPNYSEDFHSVGELNISDISEDNYYNYFETIKKLYPTDNRKPLIDIYGNWKLKQCILMIEPYVGINYAAFDYKKYSAVLHGTFHSGTACAEITESDKNYGENSILYMIDRCAEGTKSVDTYLSPSILKGGTYETVPLIGQHTANGKKIKFLYGFTKEMAYAKLLIAYSLFEDQADRRNFIETECNFEMID